MINYHDEFKMLKNEFDYADAVKECYKLNKAYLPIATDKEENEAIRKSRIAFSESPYLRKNK